MSFGIKLDGFDELQNKLSELEKAAEELDGEHDVPLKEMISDSFLIKHSKFKSFTDFSEQDIFNRYDTFEDIPQEELDTFIASNSDFSTFQELVENASVDYTRRKLGL